MIRMLDISKYDKVLEDLKSMLFSERKSRKLNKVEPNFYKNLHSFFVELNLEKDRVVTTDIKEYMEITSLLSEARKNFRAFFQVRFEKIAKYSVYEDIEEFLYNLTGEEKNILKELNSKMMGYYEDFTAIEREEEEPVEDEAVEEETVSEDLSENYNKNENFEEKKEIKPDAGELVLVRILKDQPVIAQPDRDYYLHKNDIIYIMDSFAGILDKHGACKVIQKK